MCANFHNLIFLGYLYKISDGHSYPFYHRVHPSGGGGGGGGRRQGINIKINKKYLKQTCTCSTLMAMLHR